VRVLGSVFFIGGSLIFLVSAAQVYLGKLLNITPLDYLAPM